MPLITAIKEHFHFVEDAGKTKAIPGIGFESSLEKTNNLCFRPGLKQTCLYSHKSRLEA